MKKHFFCFLLVTIVIVSFTSCKVDGYNDYTPQMEISNQAKLRFEGIKADSIIKFKVATDNSAYVFDSLHVGDTVSFLLRVSSYANKLKELVITPNDAAAVELIVPDSIKQYFLSSSDFKAGKMYPVDNVYGIVFPVKFTTLKEKETLTYSLRATSDAEKVANITGVDIKFPIKKARKN